MKLKELPYFLGLRPRVRTYGHEVRAFDLPADGMVRYAQWLHPSERPKQITQQAVDELRKFLSPGDAAIDIGAHTGDSTLPIALAVGPSGCVLALEPNRYVFPVLQRNAGLNPEKTNIVPLMFAAAPDDGELEFRYSDSGFCNGGRFEGISRWAHGHAFALKVQGRNLEAYLRAHYPEWIPRIRYIKLDTEGYELPVLRTLTGILDACRPYLKAEVFRRLDDARRRDLHRFLVERGYTVRRIEDDGNYFGPPLAAEEMSRWRHFDVFCVPAGAPQP